MNGICDKCSDGIIVARNKKSKDIFIFKCSCNVGNSVTQKIPMWGHVTSSFYEIENQKKGEVKRPPLPYKDDDDLPF